MKLDKTVQNKLIKLMSKHQNEKAKLNAGQLREALTITLKAMYDLSMIDKSTIITTLIVPKKER